MSYFDTFMPRMWYFPHPRVADLGLFTTLARSANSAWSGPMSRGATVRVQHLGLVNGSVEVRKGVEEIFQGDDPTVKSWSEHSSQEGFWYFWWF